MPEPVLLALIAAAGGAGGLVTLAKVIVDARENRHSREIDADERLAARLERRLDAAEARLDKSERYIGTLTRAMIRAGIEIPPRT